MTTTDLFEHFLDDRRIMMNVASTTLAYYRTTSHLLLSRVSPDPSLLSKGEIFTLVKELKDQGRTASAINTRLRGWNAFLNWLHTEGHMPTRLRVPLLREEEYLPHTLTPHEVEAITTFKPRSLTAKRTKAMVMFALDTGARLSEILTLSRAKVNFDDLLVTLWGKGRKERTVPLSPEGRTVVWGWARTHTRSLIFGTTTDHPISKTNASRDLHSFLRAVGVRECGWHTFRHTYATYFIDAGGDSLVLQRLLGHTTPTMTARYVHSAPQKLVALHVSPLRGLGPVGRSGQDGKRNTATRT